jgi:molybdate transport system substrate-binding protein
MAAGIGAAALVIISTISAREALHELVPQFEHVSGYKVDVTYGPGPDLAKRIREGLQADVFVGPEEFSGPLIEAGRLQGATRTAFASSGTALAIKAGAPQVDISTPEKFKAAMLNAYSAGVSGIHFVKAMESLGIADQVAAKRVMLKPGELAGEPVARGEAEIAVQQPSELLPVKGISIIGPMPAEFQRPMVYGATAFAGAQNDAAREAFVKFLKSEATRKVLREKGLDPA